MADAVPTLARLDGITIAMFYNDHPPPHVHIRGSGRNERVRIADGTLLPGSELPGAELKRVATWVEANRVVLMAAWEDACMGTTLERHVQRLADGRSEDAV